MRTLKFRAWDRRENLMRRVSDIGWMRNDSGFNATEGQIEQDMFEAGIIDAFKVTRSALENAVSASGILLTTECAITEN